MTDRFNVLGERQSVNLQDLLKRPIRVINLHLDQLVAALEEVDVLKSQASNLYDAIARQIAGPHRVIGRPLKQVRSVLRLDEGSGFGFADVEQRLAYPGPFEVRRLMADMVTAGFAVQDSPDHWKCTEKARELQTRSRGRVSRARAQAALTSFMERVRAVNDDARYVYKVDVVVLFGSYLSDRPAVGDVDVAVSLKRRARSSAEHEELTREAEARSPQFRTISDQVSWPSTEVMTALRARQSIVDVRDLHDLEGLVRRGVSLRHEVLLGYWHPPAPDDQKQTSASGR